MWTRPDCHVTGMAKGCMSCEAPFATLWPTPRLLWRREAGQWFGMYVVEVVVCMSAAGWLWCNRLVVMQQKMQAGIHMYIHICTHKCICM